MCTVRSFPSLPLHCIEWARNEFAGLFTAPFAAAAAIVAEPEEYCKRAAKEARHNPTKQLAVLRPALEALELMQVRQEMGGVKRHRPMGAEGSRIKCSLRLHHSLSSSRVSSWRRCRLRRSSHSSPQLALSGR